MNAILIVTSVGDNLILRVSIMVKSCYNCAYCTKGKMDIFCSFPEKGAIQDFCIIFSPRYVCDRWVNKTEKENDFHETSVDRQ